MPIYKVVVIEQYSKVIEQRAKSYDDAMRIVNEKYHDKEIILDKLDRDYVEFKRFSMQNSLNKKEYDKQLEL